MTVSSPPPPPSYTPAPPPAKKGMGPLGWVLIGCGGILLIGLLALGACGFWAKNKLEKFANDPDGLAFSAAKFAVEANPDLELVSSDDANKTLTIRDKKTGETTTLNLEDIKNGKLDITGADGKSVSIDASGGAEGGGVQVTGPDGQTSTFGAGAGAPKDLPSWLELYPGATVQGSFSGTTGDGKGASIQLTTSDTVEQVLEFYEKAFKDQGFQVSKSTYASGSGTGGGTVNGTSADGKSNANALVGTDGGSTTITLTYGEQP